MKIAICDDNNSICNYIEEYILALKLKDVEIEVFSSGDNLHNYIKQNNEAFHVYFMDIEMAGHNGIETAALIREMDKKALIIFITQHKDYVYKVFEVLPFRFMQKPLSTEQLDTVFRDILAHYNAVKKLFTFRQDRVTMQVYYDEILYFESIGRKITLITTDHEFVFYGKLYEIFSLLDKNMFVQIHKSYIVNLEYVFALKDSELVMKNQQPLPISKKYRNEVKEQHFRYIEWRCGK